MVERYFLGSTIPVVYGGKHVQGRVESISDEGIFSIRIGETTFFPSVSSINGAEVRPVELKGGIVDICIYAEDKFLTI